MALKSGDSPLEIHGFPKKHSLLQVAEQQGKYLAKSFNAKAASKSEATKPFVWKRLGAMATLGLSHRLLCHQGEACRFTKNNAASTVCSLKANEP